MLISILAIAILAGTMNALWFGLMSGSILVAIAAYSATGIVAVLLLAIVAAVRYDYLCNAPHRENRTVSRGSIPT